MIHELLEKILDFDVTDNSGNEDIDMSITDIEKAGLREELMRKFDIFAKDALDGRENKNFSNLQYFEIDESSLNDYLDKKSPSIKVNTPIYNHEHYLISATTYVAMKTDKIFKPDLSKATELSVYFDYSLISKLGKDPDKIFKKFMRILLSENETLTKNIFILTFKFAGKELSRKDIEKITSLNVWKKVNIKNAVIPEEISLSKWLVNNDIDMLEFEECKFNSGFAEISPSDTPAMSDKKFSDIVNKSNELGTPPAENTHKCFLIDKAHLKRYPIVTYYHPISGIYAGKECNDQIFSVDYSFGSHEYNKIESGKKRLKLLDISGNYKTLNIPIVD